MKLHPCHLANARLLGCKPTATPMTRDIRLTTNAGKTLKDSSPYRRLIGQ